MSAPHNQEPPLGLMPRKIHRQLRVIEILKAIDRYARADKEIPAEWLDELVELARIEERSAKGQKPD